MWEVLALDNRFIWGLVVGAGALFALNYFFNFPSMKSAN
jgi:hypothetical protein